MLIPLLIWVVTIFSNGTSVVSLNATLSGGFVTLALPVVPQSYLLVHVNGTTVPYILNGTQVTIPVFGTANVSVLYVPRVFVTEGFVGMYFVNNDTVEIIIPSNALIYNITLTIINMTMVNKTMILHAMGPGELYYTVLTTTKPPTPPPPPPTKPSSSFFMWVLALIIAVVVVIASVFIVVRGRRGRQAGGLTVRELNEYERSILSYLESRGGSAFEIDISRDLGMPRTTVWRSVRRLEGYGFVYIRKVEGRNLIVLRRRLRS